VAKHVPVDTALDRTRRRRTRRRAFRGVLLFAAAAGVIVAILQRVRGTGDDSASSAPSAPVVRPSEPPSRVQGNAKAAAATG
jgi:ferric-dicitrate binding protein FerR (iron transport regulator)